MHSLVQGFEVYILLLNPIICVMEGFVQHRMRNSSKTIEHVEREWQEAFIYFLTELFILLVNLHHIADLLLS